MSKAVMLILAVALLLYLVLAAVVFAVQRSMLYFPTHDRRPSGLQPWAERGEAVGCAREVPKPSAIWLMAHGNAGQASDRDYVLSVIAPDASLYVVEYPGYGARQGKPSAESMNRAVAETYARLVERFPGAPIGLIGESIGGGPICALVKHAAVQPRKIVLFVPFDTLVNVAKERLAWLPVGLLLRDRWDNVEALRGFAGPVEVYGARFDQVIPVAHARSLAAAVGAKFSVLECGHNDWTATGVRIQ